VCGAAALAPLLMLIAARERRRRVVDDLRRIAQLNHEVRDALQVIVYGEYESAATPTEHRTAILGSVEQIDKTLRQLFPVIGDRVDDQRRARHTKISNVSAFVPNRRQGV
jgi:hypothetical protein